MIPDEEQAAAPEAAVAAPAAPEAKPEGGAKPNESAERVAIAGMKMIYDQKIMPQLLQILRSGDPAEGLASATMLVMKGLFEASKGNMPPEAFIPAVQMIMPLIAELGEAAGVAKAEEALVKQAATIFAQKVKAEAGKKGAAQPPTNAQPPTQPPAQPGAGLLQSGVV